MDGRAAILDVDIPYSRPMVSGRHRMPDQLPSYQNRFLGFDAFRQHYLLNREVEPSDVVIRRFRQDERDAHIISANFNPHFGLIMQEALWTASPIESMLQGQDWYLLSFRVTGGSAECVERDWYTMGPDSCYLVHLADKINYTFRYAGEQPFTEVCLMFRPSFLATKLYLSPSDVRERLKSHQFASPYFNQYLMTADMKRAVFDLRRFCLSDPSFRIFAEAKALELISLYLKQLQENSVLCAYPLRQKEISSLNDAKQFLEQNYPCPPRVDELSRMVGLNRRKLAEGFKMVFGKTLYQYVQHQRIEAAKRMFQDNCDNIARVAEMVGYEYQGNFTKVFQQHVGMTPKDYILLSRRNSV